MDGQDGTREDTQDTTRLVEIEDLKCACYLGAAVCDRTVAGRCTQRQGGWVGGYPQMRFLPWLLWKEARGTSSASA
jgi:hypothetical protein